MASRNTVVFESPVSQHTNRERLLQLAGAGMNTYFMPCAVFTRLAPAGEEQRMRVPIFSSWTISAVMSRRCPKSKVPYFQHTEKLHD